jgi:8-oxo-dGTP diphosphatase
MTEISKQKPGIGVAIVVWKDRHKNELLLGLGHSVENRETIYAVPGGHWESGETLAEAVKREALEEAGIEVGGLEFISLYEFFNPEKNKSYVTIGFAGILSSGTPTVMEPDRKKNWEWYRPSAALALPLFIPDKVLIERAVSGTIFELQ